MEYAHLLERVGELGGLSEADAERACEVVIETLGERLQPSELELLAAELPSPAAEWLLRRRVPGNFSIAELYERVHRRSGVSLGFAVEHAQLVCEALADLLEPETLARVRAASPGPVSELLVIPLRASQRLRDRPAAASGAGETLASGRPGSRHPISEARPDAAQSQSVARSDNPHADTKLSSTSGLTQERQHRTLATGRSPRS